MWLELQKYPLYFIDCVREKKFHILVTDYIRIWEVNYSQNDFITCLKDSNEGLEMDLKELLEKGNQMLTCPNDLKSICISQGNSTLELAMTMFYGFPFYLKIRLMEGSPELFFKKVTQPTLKTIENLKSSEDKLRVILRAKDDEIEQYKKLGGKIKYTATSPYNDEAHMNKHNTYKEHFGDKDISKDLLDKEVSILSEIIKSEEPQDTIVKTEAPSQSTNHISNNEVKPEIKAENIKSESKPISRQIKKKKFNI